MLFPINIFLKDLNYFQSLDKLRFATKFEADSNHNFMYYAYTYILILLKLYIPYYT